MSEIKVNKITPRVACGTTQLGDSGDTFTVPSGATITNLGTATGFGGTGVVSWDTGSIKIAGFTAVTGTGYFCDTSGGAFSVTLPLSPSAGDVVGVSDYAKTFDTDNLTLLRNGSNIGGAADDSIINTEGLAVTLVYVDATKGWLVTDSGLQSDAPGPTFVTATGGCITTCGNDKMHTFIGPGTFCVSQLATCATQNLVSYMVVAGGGGGGWCAGGGGGAGGFRELVSPTAPYTASPLDGYPTPGNRITVTATGFPIVVGGGGPGSPSGPVAATKGSDSVFSTITSTGGGYGGSRPPGTRCGGCGGAGGGQAGDSSSPGGAGNTPATTPAQGFRGGQKSSVPHNCGGMGGGGATATGQDSQYCHPAPKAPDGGAGATSSINTTPTARAGGGGGGGYVTCGSTGGTGGTGGGGAGASPGADAIVGAINTGGGGGAGANGPACGPKELGAQGGSGVVIIRYKYQ